jgi:endonuclease-3
VTSYRRSGLPTTESVREITSLLIREYPDRAPLLDYDSPYHLLIAVILSAQTTDAQVNEVTPILFTRYPRPADLAAASPREVERIVRSTGFFRVKAKSIIGAANAIHRRFDDTVPRSMEDLTSIPGVGGKGANVIRGVVFGLPSIAVDTHLGRVVRRIGLVSTGNADRVERELKQMVPEAIQTDFSMAVNRHGRYCCYSRSPDCERCVIRDFCEWRQSGHKK